MDASSISSAVVDPRPPIQEHQALTCGSSLPGKLPLLCAVATPGALGRLCKCCRVFRTLFSTDEIWLAMCEDMCGKDVELKQPSQSWRHFYGDWVLSARAWFAAYSRIAGQIANSPSFSMRVHLGGEDLPEEWNGNENLMMSEIAFTNFGISAELELHWSDSEGYASLPEWTYKNSESISLISIVASSDQYSSSTLVSIDCSNSGLRALDFARSECVPCSGIVIDHSCYCEGDERECCDYGEDLSFAARIPTLRFLESLLGFDAMRSSAAALLGLSQAMCNDRGKSLMLFAELRPCMPYSRNQAEERPVASIESNLPVPCWYNPQHAFRFRRLYGSILQEWKQEENMPMPGFKFAFEFLNTEPTSRDDFFLSFWCLDSVGNTSLASHLVCCDTRRKFLCLTEAPQTITPNGRPRYFLGKLEPLPGPRVASGGFGHVDSQNPGIACLNLYMVPFNFIPGLERSSYLSAVYKDYCACLFHRLMCLKCPEASEVAKREVVQHFCESDSMLQILSRLCNGPLEDGQDDVMSDDSDAEEESQFWKNVMYNGQEKLIRQIRRSIEFEPHVWTTYEAGKEKVLTETEADRPQVPRRSNKGSVWLGMAPLKRCKLCRCILTGLQRSRREILSGDDSDEDVFGGKLYRNYCFKCDKLADKTRRLHM